MRTVLAIGLMLLCLATGVVATTASAAENPCAGQACDPHGANADAQLLIGHDPSPCRPSCAA